jgi:hypothetical protein
MSLRGRSLSNEASQATRVDQPHQLVAARRARRQVRLIVVELDAVGLLAGPSADGGEQTVLVAQNDGEQRMDFAARVVRRILALERDEREVSRVLLLLAPELDADVTGARLLIARALITHAATLQGGPAEVVLDVASDSGGGLPPYGFAALVDALVGEAGRGAVIIGVEFVRHTTSVTLARLRAGA